MVDLVWDIVQLRDVRGNGLGKVGTFDQGGYRRDGHEVAESRHAANVSRWNTYSGKEGNRREKRLPKALPQP